MHTRPPPATTGFLLVKHTKRAPEETKRDSTDTAQKVGGDVQPSLTARRGFKFARKQEKNSNKVKNLTPRKIHAGEAKEREIVARMPREVRALVEPQRQAMVDRVKGYMAAQEVMEAVGKKKFDSVRWGQIIQKVNREVRMFDPSEYVLSKRSDNPSQPNNDFSQNIKLTEAHPLPRLLLALLRALISSEALNQHPISDQQATSSTHQYRVCVNMRGHNRYGEEICYRTGSLDMAGILTFYLKAITSKEKETKQESLHRLWRVMGFDTLNQLGYATPNDLVDSTFSSFEVARVKGLPLSRVGESDHILTTPYMLTQSSVPLTYDAINPLYAISRARIQYLGQNIPIFKFQHSLFEALMSALHPEEVTPDGVENSTDLTQGDLLRQERFLFSKYLEFDSTPALAPLLHLSGEGKTLAFLAHFNSLRETDYSGCKLSLYDINQRRFILDEASPRKAFIVHYNGYVFGTNHSKMFTIREREIGLHREEEEPESSDASESDGPLVVERAVAQASQSNAEGEEEASSSGMVSSEDEGHANDDIISEVDMRTSFVMSSQILGKNNRRKRLLAQIPRQNATANLTSSSGLLTLQMTFDDLGLPTRLVCYGYFPWFTSSAASQKLPHMTQLGHSQATHVYKSFDGPHALDHFLLWLLHSVINYRKDSRQHTRFVNIFTLNGVSREMPAILESLIGIVGRDAHFIGDMLKLKMIWYENVRFFDLSNYFDGKPFEYYEARWLTSRRQKENLAQAASGDTLLYKVLLTFEFMNLFQTQLQSIAFNGGRTFYDLTLYAQASASSLALSVFQYMYLDKQHIKGTNDQEIFAKERDSLKPSSFTLNTSASFDPKHPGGEEGCTVNLYHCQHPIPACFRDFPIPFEFVKRRAYPMAFTFVPDGYQVNYRPQAFLDFWATETPHVKHTLKYTSLYKVEKLKKQSNVFILPRQTPFGLEITHTEIQSEYIWGAELIHAIVERGRNKSVVEYLEISEELSYLQGKVFSQFVTEIWDKYRYTNYQDQCTKDILEMILESFPAKFSQKYFGLQQIIHVNDLPLMKQTCFSTDGGDAAAPIHKLHELKHPYYYIEYFPTGSDHLQQICSLVRITSYVNACHRIRQFQHLSQFEGVDGLENVLYLDSQYLMVKNRQLVDQTMAGMKLPMAAKVMQGMADIQMGKYRLIVSETYPLKSDSDIQHSELTRYLTYFQKRHSLQTSLSLSDDQEPAADFLSGQLVKNFNLFRMLVNKCSPSFSDEEKLLETYVQIILSSPQSRHQGAPEVEVAQQRGRQSQRAMTQAQEVKPLLGVSPQQAMNLKSILVNALMKDHVPPKLKAQSQPEGKLPPQSVLDPSLLQPEDREDFLQILRTGMNKFSSYMTRCRTNLSWADRYQAHPQVQDEEDQQAEDDLASELLLRKDQLSEEPEEERELMSQAELAIALQCGEESSSSQDCSMTRLAKQSNGNLVSEFFSQNTKSRL